jgi:hypothetical protein
MFFVPALQVHKSVSYNRFLFTDEHFHRTRRKQIIKEPLGNRQLHKTCINQEINAF